MKEFHNMEYDSIYDALDDCNGNQWWNVVNIYPTGYRQQVCVVYFIMK